MDITRVNEFGWAGADDTPEEIEGSRGAGPTTVLWVVFVSINEGWKHFYGHWTEARFKFDCHITGEGGAVSTLEDKKDDAGKEDEPAGATDATAAAGGSSAPRQRKGGKKAVDEGSAAAPVEDKKKGK